MTDKLKRLREWAKEQRDAASDDYKHWSGSVERGVLNAERLAYERVMGMADRLMAEPEAPKLGVLPSADADGSVLLCEVLSYGKWTPARMPVSLRLRRTGDMGPGHVQDYAMVDTSEHDAPKIVEPEAPPTDAAIRDWTEDAVADPENGTYCCKCVTCRCWFIGYKRRVVCKKCATVAPPTDAEFEAAISELVGAHRIDASVRALHPDADGPFPDGFVASKRPALLALIARKVEAASGDDGLLKAAKAVVAHWETHGIVGVPGMPTLLGKLWEAIVAREAGGAQ